MEIDELKAKEKAVTWANSNHVAVYKTADRKLLPRKGELGWNKLFQEALARILQGKTLAGLRKDLLEYAAQPYPEKDSRIRLGVSPTVFGKVRPKDPKY